MTTHPFGPRNPPDDPLLARAAELPKYLAPPRDLWPAIAARIAAKPEQAKPRMFGWPAALAAAALIATVSALLTWGLMRESGPATPIADTRAVEPAIVPVNYGSRSWLTAAEIAARDELYLSFRDKFGQLRPETREAVLKNLAIIQHAADEIDAALAQDPASAMLNGLLVGAYKQELQLYSMVVTAGDGNTRRT